MITRRRFLQASALGGAALTLPAVAGCAPSVPVPVDGAFTHGVASGDPHADSVVLWTRVNPAGRTGPVALRWQVATDEAMTDVVATGQVMTDGSRDWTAKVVAGGLAPGTTHHFRFVDDDAPGGPATSPTGRTRTAPDGPVDVIRFGVASCSNYGYGNFHAYRHLLRRDLDAVIHLGDYIYEYASDGWGETYGVARTLEPRTEIRSVDDYRLRYGLYRADPDLQELHRLHPMIHVWDDHEFADDPFVGGASNHQPAEDGDWDARVAAALQAYTEWMPTRIDGNRIFRTLDYGPLARIVGLDRQRRFLWPEPGDGDLYLGAAQFDWLDDRLAETDAAWCVLAQQTTFGSTSPDLVGGGWGARDRNRVLDAVSGGPSDLVVLTGDIHRFHALDVVRDPAAYVPSAGTGSGAVEFAAGSISSPGSDAFNPGPQVRWNSGFNRGYAVVTLTPESVQSDFWGFNDLLKVSAFLPDEQWLAGFTARKGSPYLRPAPRPLS
jgi:alkaline phosphatase D